MTVAVVGLGAMGRRVGQRLLDAGHEVVVWNRTRARAAELVARGALAADTPAAASRRADAVITMVADPPALRAVSEGRDGIAAGVTPSTAVIEMSTVGPGAVSRLASVLPAGTPLVDAPVLGSLAEAEAGGLTIFAGGGDADVARVAPLLAVLGRPVHVGPTGAGAAAKLVANASLFAVLAALGEAVALGDGLALAREATYQVLAATPLAAEAERRRAAIESGNYPLHFALALAHKDAGLISEAAAAAGVDLRVGAAVHTWLSDAFAAGHSRRDYSSLLEQIIGAT